MKQSIWAVLAAFLGVAAGLGSAYVVMSKPKPMSVCVAGLNELCPSEQFTYDSQHLKELRADVAKKASSAAIREFQDEVDTVNGLQQRLNTEINLTKGCGPTAESACQWNDGKGKFTQYIPPVVQPIPGPSGQPSPQPPVKPAGKK